MTFEWDEKKNRINVAKHGIRFEDAQAVFSDPFHISIEDDLHSHGEERWITLGDCRGKSLVCVPYVPG